MFDESTQKSLTRKLKNPWGNNQKQICGDALNPKELWKVYSTFFYQSPHINNDRGVIRVGNNVPCPIKGKGYVTLDGKTKNGDVYLMDWNITYWLLYSLLIKDIFCNLLRIHA